MPPKLAEILGLENPYGAEPTASMPNQGLMLVGYNRALEDAWAKLEALRVSGKEAGTVGYAGPGWLLWLPDAGDDLADQDSLEAQEMFECCG